MCALSADIAGMDVLSLKYWLFKFVMEVAKKSGERCPPKSVYGIILFFETSFGGEKWFTVSKKE